MVSRSLAVLIAFVAVHASAAPIAPDAGLSIDDAVREAVTKNSSVRAAEAQYKAALHQIDQAYTPADPLLSISPSQTPNGFTYAQTRTVGISESFQFPGTALLQGSQAQRNAKIAQLVYMAAVRDATAQAQAAYYQTLLDSASVRINMENADSIAQVLEVVRIAYTANQNAQTDLISGQFALSQASQTVLTSQVAEANDEAALNQVMERHPRTPMQLTSELDLKPFDLSLDVVTDKALAFRQEVLEAALTEKNSNTALKLAWMELLPNFTVSWARNNYPPNSINAPRKDGADPTIPGDLGSAAHDFTTSISFNVPIFFWFHQKEDIKAASNLLEAARQNRDSVEIQTETNVVQLYRSTQLAYKNAILNKDVLEPLASQNLRVALVAYQSKKIDFVTLASILQNLFTARINYLTAANQFLAGRVALEQAMGGPLAK